MNSYLLKQIKHNINQTQIKKTFLNDFLFFILIVKNYIRITQTNLLFILSKFLIKYIIYLKNISKFIYTKPFYNQSYHLIFSNLNYSSSLTHLKYTNIKNIQQKILLVKKVSRTRKKGRVRRYKVILIIGNKTGWLGYGCGKDYTLQEAILKARQKAFNTIYYIPIHFFYNTSVQYNNKHLYIKTIPYHTFKASKQYIIRSLFDCIGCNNVTSKIIGTFNVYNIINIILKSFLIYKSC